MSSDDIPPPSTERRREPHQQKNLLVAVFADAAPLDLRIVGRTLLHATAVGLGAGAMACLLFFALELLEQIFIEGLAGYQTLRSAGELAGHPKLEGAVKRPWLLALLPAAGALCAGFLAHRLGPECLGAGADASINAFHQHDGHVRRRVIWLKPLVTVLTLGLGGAGGREGPTMHIGGAIGSTIGRYLRLSARERRILLVAGMAAGTSAIFRTPLGAALLSVEVLYRDDFEADAVVPAVIASVVGYSVFIGVYGEGTLFAVAPEYPFVIAHLPLYVVMALLVCGAGAVFVSCMRGVEALAQRWPLGWRAGIGGLVVGLVAMFVVLVANERAGIGILGGGYGAAQAAITGADWLPPGWQAVMVLALLAVGKMVATAFTIGSGGSAGAFAPALAVGALVGGGFGHAVQLLTGDPSINPGAFALVGMGTLYGGIAHAPLGALVIVCEMAGSYDLLVPLMLSCGLAFVALRRSHLYRSQPQSLQDSPAHPMRTLDILSRTRVSDVMVADRPFVRFSPATPVSQVMREVSQNGWQDVFPVLDQDDKLVGMITPELLRLLAAEREIEPWLLVVDAMQPPVTVHRDQDLRIASEQLFTHGLRELLVVDDTQRICGFIDEADIAHTYLDTR